MVFFEVRGLELREECDQLIINNVLPVENLFDQHKIDRCLISDEEGDFFLLEWIAPSLSAIDAVQIYDIPDPENRIPHLVAVADSLLLGIQVELFE